MVRHPEESEERVSTDLSILPDHPISTDSYHFYKKHNQESPPLKNNQLSIYGIELSTNDGGSMEATALIRSTVHKPIRLKTAPILLIDKQGRPVARHVFNLEQLGSLPPNSARPWTFHFPAEAFIKGAPGSTGEMDNGKSAVNQMFDLSSWRLAFERKAPVNQVHQLDLSSANGLKPTPEIKRKLEKVIEDSPPLAKDEINFTGLSLQLADHGGLIAILLVRNGTSRDITLKRVPLEVTDATKKVVARGTFQLKDFIVKANTSKPTRFVFPASSIVKHDLDLSTWRINHVNPEQKK